MSFYKKNINVYRNAQLSSKPVQENAALAFEAIAKKIDEFELLYAEKKFEQACNKVSDTLTLCEGLSGLLIDITLDGMQVDSGSHQVESTLDWQTYFIELMRTISSLASDHNPQKKEKLINSLKALAQEWRNVSSLYENTVKTGDTDQQSFNLDA